MPERRSLECWVRGRPPAGQVGPTHQRGVVGSGAGGRVVEGQIDAADGTFTAAVGHKDGALAGGRDDQQSPISSGNSWLSPLRVTFTSVTEEPSPSTAITEG
jgi:hypothetical protein